MSKLYNIVKSRFIKGSDLPQWYENRLDKCASCDLNSGNSSNKTVERQLWQLVADNHCTHKTCNCTITQKAKIETEFCPLNKWLAIKPLNGNLKITTNTDKGKLEYDSLNNKYIFSYKPLNYMSNSDVTFSIYNQDVNSISMNTSCGCTSAVPVQTDYGVDIKVTYDSSRLGPFNKNVSIAFKTDNGPKQTYINIIGKVIR